jgi:glucoamylase
MYNVQYVSSPPLSTTMKGAVDIVGRTDSRPIVIKMPKLRELIILYALCQAAIAEECDLPDIEKLDCGYLGITQGECEISGCCWIPDDTHGIPWCYRKRSEGSCFILQRTMLEPFNKSELESMWSYFVANIDIEGNGGVVAAPDPETPGGSYIYHWMRDGALTMKTFQDMIPTYANYSEADPKLKSFVSWVLQSQSLVATNGVDIRIEPKFLLPECALFTDPWCRPQNDGPGLQV